VPASGTGSTRPASRAAGHGAAVAGDAAANPAGDASTIAVAAHVR